MTTKRPEGFEYQRYLASREWALLKEQVRERCGGWCEHCHASPYQSTHHLTYARIGHEDLADLAALCNPCHAWVSGKDPINPLAMSWAISEPLTRAGGQIIHLVHPLLTGESYDPGWRATDVAFVTCSHARHSIFGNCSWCTAGMAELGQFLYERQGL